MHNKLSLRHFRFELIMKHNKEVLLVVESAIYLALSHKILNIFLLHLIAQKLKLIISFILGAASST